jgi:enterochelin esterase family protein
MKVAPSVELSVSVFLPRSTPALTSRFWAQHDSYVSGPRDFTAYPELKQSIVKPSWYFLSDLEVLTSARTGAIAAHKAKSMIIVNANGMADVELEPHPSPPARSDANGRPPAADVTRYFMEQRYPLFDSILMRDLVPFIDANFRTISDREHRALAGLSMGGAQALRIGFNHLDQFAYLGAFSPAIDITDVRKDYDGILENSANLNKELRLLWIGVGREDFLYSQVRESHEGLERAAIRHAWIESSGGHVWTVWRKCLADFAPRLFR